MLDLKYGTKIYLCLASEIKKAVPEMDFGVWDNEYLCVVGLQKNRYQQVKLSSRKQDIKEGLNWAKIILKHAVLVKDLDKDIAEFIKKKSN